LDVHREAPVSPYREHIDRLWPLAAGLVNGLTAQHYVGRLLGSNAFVDWRVDHRYADGVPVDEAGREEHLRAATDLLMGAQLARQDGLL
jgi:hypothetical protein